jgi:Beta-glucanase/Beta-glucan synthetase
MAKLAVYIYNGQFLKILKMRNIVAIVLLVVTTCFACSKSGGSNQTTTPTTVPALSIVDVVQARNTKSVSNFRFFINLDKTSTKTITVQYTTIAGTAVADKDYTTTSGTLTITPNQSVAYIDVPVIGDSLRQPDETFYVQLSNPVNATISGTGKATGTIQNNGTYYPTDSAGYTSPTSYSGYTLVWSDEFNGTSINTNDWNFETGGGGWGNNELEYYTNSSNNAYVSNGNLIIEARQETMGSNNYTSARMNTSGKHQFQYGRIDIRAKLPVASGLWPALWMLGSNFSSVGWPACGETDIMELVGSAPSKVVGSIHWALSNGSSGTYNNSYSLSSGDFSQQFHVFSLIWKQNYMQILVDGTAYMTATDQNLSSGTWPFNAPQFLIFNVAVGGNWPGSPSASTVFPQRMFVDYIRVFQ